MKKLRYNSSDNDYGNIFWVTMSDLLLGLLVVFIVLFIFAITGFTQNKVQQQKSNYKVSEKLEQKFSENNINVNIDKMSGAIRISNLELFELNKSELSEKGIEYLNKFVPIYLKTLFADSEISKNITKIVIEGHTDSQSYSNAKSLEENYIKNMDLSLKRASSVAKHIVYNNSVKIDLSKLLLVTGKSYSEPILEKGKEDYDKSRRVELKIIYKDPKVTELIKNSILK